MINSYETLPIKYRPQKFADLLGQDVAVSSIKNAILKNKIGTAYIFFGPRGVGKTTLARIFAKRLNCSSPIGEEPCNNCASCNEIKQTNSSDVLEIDAASNRGIEYIRELRENVKFLPMHGKYKVYIIDEVHMLTEHSFNALLKTLEEPPEYIVFILATTEIHKIPETILSRCQDFYLKKVNHNELSKYLINICKIENIEYDEKGLFWIMKEGDGSVRDSLSFMEQANIFTNSKLLGSLIEKLVGYDGVDHSIQLVLSFFKESNLSIQLVEKLFQEGRNLQKFIWNTIDIINTKLLLDENLPLEEFSNFPKDDLLKIKNELSNLEKENLIFLSNEFLKIYQELIRLRINNSFETKIFLVVQFRNIFKDISSPSLSGVLTKINNLISFIHSENNNESNKTSEEKTTNKDLESILKEKFLGTEVDKNKQPRI